MENKFMREWVVLDSWVPFKMAKDQGVTWDRLLGN